MCYRNPSFGITFETLKDLPRETISQVVSLSAQSCYMQPEFGINFEELKNLPSKVIKYLTSNSAQECYRQGYFTFNDIKAYSQRKIFAIIVSSTQAEYVMLKALYGNDNAGFREALFNIFANFDPEDPEKSDIGSLVFK